MTKLNGYYKIYFETKHKDYMDYIKEISSQCDKSFWYFHPGGKENTDRPHIHGCIVNCKLTDDSLRDGTKNRTGFKKQFGLEKPTEHGISNTFKKGTKMSEDTVFGYAKYCAKGQYMPVYYTGEWPDKYNYVLLKNEDFFISARGEWVDPEVEKIEVKLKVNKLTQWQIADEVCIRMMSKLNDDRFDFETAISLVREVCNENKTLCHKRIACNILEDVQSRLNPKTWSSDVEKMFYRF